MISKNIGHFKKSQVRRNSGKTWLSRKHRTSQNIRRCQHIQASRDVRQKQDIQKIRGYLEIWINHDVGENGTSDKFGGTCQSWKIMISGKMGYPHMAPQIQNHVNKRMRSHIHAQSRSHINAHIQNHIRPIKTYKNLTKQCKLASQHFPQLALSWCSRCFEGVQGLPNIPAAPALRGCLPFSFRWELQDKSLWNSWFSAHSGNTWDS